MDSLWLQNYRRNVTSQCGEDGVIEAIFERIGAENHFCIEFGAGDGIENSNTHSLITQGGWTGILIEGRDESYCQLVENLAGHNACCLHKIVAFRETNEDIDCILDNLPIDVPINPDLMSIDIDGNEYHIWQEMVKYVPWVVLVEFNPTIPSDISFVQPKNINVNHGNSLKALCYLAGKKGYSLACVTSWNAFFVREEKFPLLGIEDSRIEVQWFDRDKWMMRLFQLYDGTLVLRGLQKLLWRNRRISQEDIQVLPEKERYYGGAIPEGRE